jgi:hypothetical protein
LSGGGTGNLFISSTFVQTGTGAILNVFGGFRLGVTGAGQAPATSSSTGSNGEVRVDSDYIYVCTATNTWKRVALSTW